MSASCIRCGRTRDPEELIQLSDGLVCEPCLTAEVKAEERRDSIDDALAALRAVAKDGVLMVHLDIEPGGPVGIGVRYYRVGKSGPPLAEVATHGNVATVARTMRELATIIASLPAPTSAEAT